MAAELLTTEQLAAELGVAKHTLENWRYMKTGPSWTKVGGGVRYRRRAIEAYLNAQTQDAA